MVVPDARVPHYALLHRHLPTPCSDRVKPRPERMPQSVCRDDSHRRSPCRSFWACRIFCVCHLVCTSASLAANVQLALLRGVLDDAGHEQPHVRSSTSTAAAVPATTVRPGSPVHPVSASHPTPAVCVPWENNGKRGSSRATSAVRRCKLRSYRFPPLAS